MATRQKKVTGSSTMSKRPKSASRGASTSTHRTTKASNPAQSRWENAVKKISDVKKEAEKKLIAFRKELHQKLEDAKHHSYSKGYSDALNTLIKKEQAIEKAIFHAKDKVERAFFGKITPKKKSTAKTGKKPATKATGASKRGTATKSAASKTASRPLAKTTANAKKTTAKKTAPSSTKTKNASARKGTIKTTATKKAAVKKARAKKIA